MRKQTFTPSSSALFRLLLFLFLSTTVFLWGCDKAKEAVSPAVKKFVAEQVQTIKAGNAKEEKDEKYKTDKTGQYVSKDVQVPENGGKVRSTRPKFDAADAINALSLPPDEPCPPYTDCGGGGSGGGGTPTATVTSTFVTSEIAGSYLSYPNTNAIYDLKVIKGSSSSINTGDLPGYFKINVDLNKGAGGKYIYLCFTRDSNRVQGSDSGPSGWINNPASGRYVPVRDIIVNSSTINNGLEGWPLQHCSPPIEVKDAFGFHIPDLNDGAGGNYIYAYQVKCSTNALIVKEVGVIYGNSGSIQPPSGWRKIPGDLNDGAGGDYVFFCVKN